MNHARQTCRWAVLLAFGLAACGGGGNSPDSGASTDAYCGTSTNPGMLTLTGLSPALGSSVPNQHIVHGFTVVNAPAVFTNFTLAPGASHTAGQPTPDSLKLQMTPVGSDLVYQLTIASWAHTPGHVELVASNGYATSKGCVWEFPTPLFSYDVSATPDGGQLTEVGGDGGARPFDTALDGSGPADAPENFDFPVRESGGRELGFPQDIGGSPDGGTALDAPIDLAPIDAGPG